MSNQEREPSEPEKEARPQAPRPSYPPAAPSGPSLEIERDGAMPPPGAESFRPVETFVREDVLPSFSDRRPAPTAPPFGAPAAPPPPPTDPRPAAPRPPAAPASVQGPAPAPPSPAEGEPLECANAQLAGLRVRNRLLKFILVALTGVILLIAGSAVFFYNKLSSFFPAAELYQSGPMDSFSSDPAAQLKAVFGGQSPAPLQGQSGGSLFLVKSPDGSPAPGAGPGGPQISPEQAEAVKGALARYADKPLVKEFFADLKKDPSYGSLFNGDKPTPAVVARMMNNPAAMQTIIMKYASRPEFMGLMMEFINDPAMKPVLGGMNMQAMPLPGGPKPVQSAPPAGERPEGAVPPSGEPRLDTNAISGPSSARKVAPKTVPAP